MNDDYGYPDDDMRAADENVLWLILLLSLGMLALFLRGLYDFVVWGWHLVRLI